MSGNRKSTYALVVKFSGLCAFVPEDEVSDNSVSAMHVLLVAANSDNSVTLEDQFLQTDLLDDHFAFLVFDPRNLPGINAFRDASEEDVPRGAWQLFAEEIFFYTSATDSRVRLRTTGATLPEPKSDYEQTDFIWLPKIEDVQPGAGYIDELLVAPDDTVETISACIHLTGGEISSSDLGSPAQASLTLHRFLPAEKPDAPLEQVLASEMEWRVDELEGDVRIRLRNFKTGVERDLILTPQIGDDGSPGDILVKLVDLCCPAIFEYVGFQSPTTGAPRPDVDFTWFYLLSGIVVNDAFPVLPVPVRFPNTGAGGGEPQICSGCSTRPPVRTRL